MIIDFNHAKMIAAGCLAMSSCAFFLWVNQSGIQADQLNARQPESSTTTQFVASQAVKNPIGGGTDQSLVDSQDHGNYACLDQEQVDDNGNLNVAGWHATNASQGRQYHHIIAYDVSNNCEIARKDITNNEVSRPDVAKVHPVYGAANSGFKTSFHLEKQLANLNQVRIISRYTDDQAGNGNSIDYWFAPFTVNRSNRANLDGAVVKDNQLELTGWHATNLAANKPYHYIIVVDRTANGHEVCRVLVKNEVARPDVARAFDGIDGAGQSGFNVDLPIAGLNFSHQLQVLSRYSASADGNSNYVDYWFNPLTSGSTVNQGNFDGYSIADGHYLTVTGWHATNISNFENNHFLILYDETAGRQVGVTMATPVIRPDVAKALPNVNGSQNAGFSGQFDLATLNLVPGHRLAVVSRYSTSSNGNGSQGQLTDCWLAPFTLNQQANNIDSVTTTKDGVQVTGWLASDYLLNHQHPFVIILDNGKEVSRCPIKWVNRPDVARVYSQIYNSANSGFSTLVRLDPTRLTGNVQVLLRLASDDAGNQNTIDQISSNYATNDGFFDTVQSNGRQLTVSGWHASDQSLTMPYQYLIVVDQNRHELGRWKVTGNQSRSDLAQNRSYIYNSGKAGFSATLTIPSGMNGHMFTLIHRFSNDPNGNGQYSDYSSTYYLQPNGQLAVGVVRFNGNTYHFDAHSHQMTKNASVDGVYFDGNGRLVNGNFSTRIINWFVSREGKLTYSQSGSRNGSDGTADCSGSMTAAVYSAGGSYPQAVYNTNTLPGYLLANGYRQVYNGYDLITPQYGDIIFWYGRDYNHVVVASGTSDNPMVISTSYLTKGQPGTAIQELNYGQYWQIHGRDHTVVYRLADQARN